MNNLGTWIDWQYLQNAAKLLAKVSVALVSMQKRVDGAGFNANRCS